MYCFYGMQRIKDRDTNHIVEFFRICHETVHFF